MRHYIEPVGWLLVCLLFMALLAFAIVPLVNDRSQPARQPAFDGKVMKPSGKLQSFAKSAGPYQTSPIAARGDRRSALN